MNRLDVVEQIITCTRCELHAQCTGPVSLRGEPGPIVLIGEAPGETEDREGKPFVGPAGKLLDELLEDAGITVSAWLNTASCYPHGTPTWEHITACRPNVEAQLDYLDPTWVLLLGRVALAGFRPDIPLKRGRGRPFKIDGRLFYTTYHPAAALRSSGLYDCMRGDLELFRDVLDAGAENWMSFIPDSCAACPNPAEWFEETGFGWCPIHAPAKLRAAYEAHQAKVTADIDAARHRRDEALAQVEAAADPTWLDQAYTMLVDWLRTHQTWFVDEIWVAGLAEPREARALGVVVQRAAREGLMRKSGEFRKSVRSHLSSKVVWESLIYGSTS